MRRQLFPALMMMVIFTVVTGIIFPLAVTGVAQVAFRDKADGSLVENADGDVVGSSLIGQTFTEPEYFHPRPSAAGDGYDPTLSSGSNLGPTNDALLDTVEERVAAYREENDLADDAEVPVDAIRSADVKTATVSSIRRHGKSEDLIGTADGSLVGTKTVAVTSTSINRSGSSSDSASCNPRSTSFAGWKAALASVDFARSSSRLAIGTSTSPSAAIATACTGTMASIGSPRFTARCHEGSGHFSTSSR